MRALRATFLIAMLLAPAALPPVAAEDATGTPLAEPSERALAALRDALLHDADGAAEAVDAAERDVFDASIVDASAAVAAWREAAGARGNEGARPRLLEAEAALVDVAAQNALAAAAAGDADAAREWLRVVLARVEWSARSVPAAPLLHPEAPLDEEAFREVVHAAVAARAREEAVRAMLLTYAGERELAAASARGASAFADTLLPDAAARLPKALEAAFVENASRIDALLDELPEARKDHALSAIVGPLVALEYDRDVEALDEFGVRNSDAAFAAARAAVEDPAVFATLSDEVVLQFAADRAGLFLRGEGGLEALDAAYETFRAAAPSADAALVGDAAAKIHAALQDLALLQRGIVLKVETGGVQPGRVHEYGVTLVRPSLEGVASYHLEIAYDPSVVAIVGVVPRALTSDFVTSIEDGRAIFGGSSGVPLERSAPIAKIRLEARGPGGSATNLTVVAANFLEPDGDAIDVFRLRHGSATVAIVPDAIDEAVDAEVAADESASRAVPAAAWSALAAGGALAAVARRRRS